LTNICMLAYTHYLSDPRVRREAEALADRGYHVDFLCLRGEGEQSYQEVNGVHVIRLPQNRYRGRSLWAYVYGYSHFFVLSFLRLTWLQFRKGYALIQVHTMPDFMVFAAVMPKIMGSKIVLDIHDLMPELYCTKFGLAEDHPIIKIITLFERLSTRFAHRVIAVHRPQSRLLVKHGIPHWKIQTIMNAVDDKIFRSDEKIRRPDKKANTFTLVYHGTLVKRYGVDVAIRAVRLAKEKIPRLRFLIYGEGNDLDELEALAEELNLSNTVIFSRKFLPLEQIPPALAQADVGLVPNRDTGRDNVLPTKLLEYVTLGIPAIVSRTDTVEAYFDDTMVRFVRPGDEQQLTEAILELYYHPEKARHIAQNAHRYNEQYGWTRQRAAYYSFIDSLLHDSPR
jgi:glycosyltransferase involved in cell wall biosynthesis